MRFAPFAAAVIAALTAAGCAAVADLEMAPYKPRIEAPTAVYGGDAALPPPIDAATGGVVALDAFTAALAAADIVVLGEMHDNAEHHAWQAWIVHALQAARGVDGLAFEMIPTSLEGRAAAHLARGGSVAELGDALKWEERGWPDWSLYAPIVAAAPAARITGGGFDRGALRALSADPSAWPLAARYGVTTPLPEAEQTAREAEQIAAHCNMLPAVAAPPMVTAQRIWDASFADAALRAWAGDGDGDGDRDDALAVLITGSQHARNDRGAPAALAIAAPERKVVSVGMIEGGPSDAVAAASRYDYVVFTGAPERGDPCAAFKS